MPGKTPFNLVCRYQERGFPFGYVTSYNGFESGDVEVSICEGKIGSVDVVYVDDSGNPVVGRNETPKDVVLRSSPFRVQSLSLCTRHQTPFRLLSHLFIHDFFFSQTLLGGAPRETD